MEKYELIHRRRFRVAGIILSVALLIIVGAQLITSSALRGAWMSSTISKSAYIDKAGKMVIDASRYENAGKFSDGLAPVKVSRQG